MRAFRSLRRWGAVAAFLAGAFLMVPLADGQPPKGADKEITAKGQVKLGVHRFKMEVGKLYLIRVEANGFTPAVTIRPGQFSSTGDQFVQGDTFTAYFLPTETREYRITVHPSTDDDETESALQDYAITVTPIPMAPMPMLKQTQKIALTDPPYNNPAGGNRGPHKAFDVNFKAGQVYIITVDASPNQQFDPYLHLEGAGGKVLAQDDDGGEGLNSRLFFKAKKGGPHRLIVTSLGKTAGEFTITVKTTVAGLKGDGPPPGAVDPSRE